MCKTTVDSLFHRTGAAVIEYCCVGAGLRHGWDWTSCSSPASKLYRIGFLALVKQCCRKMRLYTLCSSPTGADVFGDWTPSSCRSCRRQIGLDSLFLIQQVMQADGTSLDVDMKSEKLIAVQRTTCPTKTTTLNLKTKNNFTECRSYRESWPGLTLSSRRAPWIQTLKLLLPGIKPGSPVSQALYLRSYRDSLYAYYSPPNNTVQYTELSSK